MATDAITRRTLERAGERLRAAEAAGKTVGSQLLESVLANRAKRKQDPPKWNADPPGLFAGRRFSAEGASTYRDIEAVRDESENGDLLCLFTDEPTLDADGTPITNSSGEFYAFLPGAGRRHRYFGDAIESFELIAAEAGRCLLGLPRHLQQLFPIETLQTHRDELRWIYAVYDLAWDRFAGSPLPDASRFVWDDNVRFRLDEIASFRKMFPQKLKAIPDPPEHWFAEFEDLISASGTAIDVLLATWDSVPRGWVGCTAPENSEELLAYLRMQLMAIESRGQEFPHFWNSTETTRFNDCYPRKWWWPYRRYANEQLRAAIKASDNVICWLDDRKIVGDRPPGVLKVDSLVVAVAKLNDLLFFVQRESERAPTEVKRFGKEPGHTTTTIGPREQLRGELRERIARLMQYDPSEWVSMVSYGMIDSVWLRMAEIGDDYPPRPSIPVTGSAVFVASIKHEEGNFRNTLLKLGIDPDAVVNAIAAAICWCGNAPETGTTKTPPPPAEGTRKGEGNGGKPILKPAHRLAWLSFVYAEQTNEKSLLDQEAHDWLTENGLPSGKGEFANYKLPAFDTWSRYLREAREAQGESKYGKRKGRRGRKSIVLASEIESPKKTGGR